MQLIFILIFLHAPLGDQAQELRTEITSSNHCGSTQLLMSSMLAQEMVETNASNALAQSHSRYRSPVPTTQQPVQRSTIVDQAL